MKDMSIDDINKANWFTYTSNPATDGMALTPLQLAMVAARVAAADTRHTCERAERVFRRAIDEGLLAAQLLESRLAKDAADMKDAADAKGEKAEEVLPQFANVSAPRETDLARIDAIAHVATCGKGGKGGKDGKDGKGGKKGGTA